MIPAKIKILVVVFLLTIHKAIFCIRPNDFCGLRKELDECKGLHSHKCLSTICTKKIIDCTDYLKMNTYLKSMLKNKVIDTKLVEKFLKTNNKIIKFNNKIKKCDYKFEANDFCLNRRNCTEKKISPTGLGYKYINFKVDCKCPSKQNFRCDQFCTAHSDACDYYRLNSKISNQFSIMNECVKENMFRVNSFFSSVYGKK